MVLRYRVVSVVVIVLAVLITNIIVEAIRQSSATDSIVHAHI